MLRYSSSQRFHGIFRYFLHYLQQAINFTQSHFLMVAVTISVYFSHLRLTHFLSHECMLLKIQQMQLARASNVVLDPIHTSDSYQFRQAAQTAALQAPS